MRQITAVLALLLTGVAAAILATPSASHNVVAPEHGWFRVAIKATQTGDASEVLRGSVQGLHTELAGYLRVQATVENVGAVPYTGNVLLTVAHPTGELTRVLAGKVALASASEFLRGSARQARPTSVTFSATVPCDCPGAHVVKLTASPTLRGMEPATASAIAMVY